MAIYTDLYALAGQVEMDTLRKKIIVAIVIKANALAKANPTAKQKEWAIDALRDPKSFLDIVLNYILGEYNLAATTAISGAADGSVQTAVNAAVDTLLGV